jgi:uncharacterized membrane protein YraQ (UPF0718 family)
MTPRRRISTFDWSTGVIAAVTLAAGGAVYLRMGLDRVVEILIGDVGLMLYMTPKVLAGCVLGTLVALLLPREMVTRWVGAESGWLGFVIPFLAALILPGNPLTIFPVAGALLAVGADIGAVVVFITTWALLGYQRALVWELPFLGQDFVLWRIVVSLPLPFIAGFLARMAFRTKSGGP